MKKKIFIGFAVFIVIQSALYLSNIYAQGSFRERVRERIKERWLEKKQAEDSIGAEDYHSNQKTGYTSGPGEYSREVPGWPNRPYDLYIPNFYNASRSTSVIIVLHGGGGNSKNAIQQTCPDGKLDNPKCIHKLGNREGFIVVAPNGTPNPVLKSLHTWNAGGGNGYNCVSEYACKNNIDDISYFKALLDDLVKTVNVDQSRIYSTGISNGAAMSYRLACEMSDRIAAIAPVSGGFQFPVVPCNPKRAVSIVHFHGTNDKGWPYEGGVGGINIYGDKAAEKGIFYSIPQTLQKWIELDGCDKIPVQENLPDKVQDGTKVTKITYSGCRNGAEIVHYKIENGGHTWPDGWQYAKEEKTGKVSRNINANEVMLEFFKNHPTSGQEAAYLFGPGDHDFTLEHDGLTRVYSVHVPPSYDPEVSTPVIIVMHGGGGNVRSMRSFTLLDQTSDKEGFIVVYPEGTGPKVAGKTVGSWNAGRCCPDASYKKIDDVGFISSMIEQLKKDFNVDPRRIFATGHSNGAQMSFRLACELSDKIAAIAPVSAQGVFDSCAPKRPVPVMYFYGTADSCAPYNGGTAGGCFQDILNELMGTKKEPYTWQADSVPIYTERWVKLNGVSGEPKITYQKGNAVCQTWGESEPGEVVLCTIQGMGHTWPGGTYGDPCKFPNTRFCKLFKDTMGPLSNDIIANDAMWEFFKKHPMK